MPIQYNLVKHIGKLSSYSATSKEINLIKWEKGQIYIDIRKWSNGEAHKGISLTLDEAKKLKFYIDSAIISLENMTSNNNFGDTNNEFVEELQDADISFTG